MQSLVKEIDKSITESASKSGDYFLFEKELGVSFKELKSSKREIKVASCNEKYDQKKIETFFYEGEMILVTLGRTANFNTHFEIHAMDGEELYHSMLSTKG